MRRNIVIDRKREINDLNAADINRLAQERDDAHRHTAIARQCSDNPSHVSKSVQILIDLLRNF